MLTYSPEGAPTDYKQVCIGGLPIRDVLKELKNLGIQSVMVEGGAKVIASFLTQPVVDTIIVTVAPMFVGDGGIGYSVGDEADQVDIESISASRT